MTSPNTPLVPPCYRAAMRTSDIIVLLNPAAGAATVDGEQLQRLFAACDGDTEIVQLSYPDEVETAAKRAIVSQPKIIVIGGGDGTLSAAAGVLAGTGIPMGILPLGTLNHFANDLRIPADIGAAVETICRGQAIPVDVGRVNGRLFLNNSSLGLYPHIVRRRDELRPHIVRNKWVAFTWALFSVFRWFPMVEVGVEIGNNMLVRHTPLLFIGNNSYTMRGLKFTERKHLDQAHLDLHIVKRPDRLGLMILVARVLSGRFRTERDLEQLHATRIMVHTRSQTVTVAVDGELRQLNAPLLYEIVPQSLMVKVPDGYPDTSN